MEEKKSTGYPSVDKPWLKYYTEEAINTEIPQCTIYQNIYNHNKDYPNDIALLYFGKKIIYKQLFTEIDKATKAFIANGVRYGENVVICAPAIPETIYAILALNKIGANAVMLNPLFTEEQLVDRVSETEAKLMVVANELYERVEKVIPKTAIEVVVSCPAVNSLGAIIKLLKKTKTIPNTITWNDFLKQGKTTELFAPEYKANWPAIMVYSSGTTGASKGIQLTNDGVNATITQYKVGGYDFQRQDRYFAQIPVWFSTGICVTMLVPLLLGITVILEPLYDFEIFAKDIIKYEPNFLITASGLMDHLMNVHPKAKAYKKFKYLCIGGEYVAPCSEIKYNKWLADNGNDKGLHKGYGMCECGGTVTASSYNCNVIGSAGIPTPHITVAAFELETGKECKYGDRGEIRVLTPCRMLGYYKNPAATAEYFYEDEQGQIWACTGDMGYVTEDGSVYVDGRISSSYKNAVGETIYLFDIERAILDIDSIRQCKVVVSDINCEKMHVAHIVLTAGVKKDTILRHVKDYCSGKLPANHTPKLVKLYDTALPVAPSGKLDVTKMERDTNNLLEI